MIKKIILSALITIVFIVVSEISTTWDALFVYIFFATLFWLFFFALFLDVSNKVIDILNYIIEKEKYVIPTEQQHIFLRKNEDNNIIKFLESYTEEIQSRHEYLIEKMWKQEINGVKVSKLFWLDRKEK